MKRNKLTVRLLALALVFFFEIGQVQVFASSSRFDEREEFSNIPGRGLASFENSFIQNTRLVQFKNEIQFLEDENAERRSSTQKTEVSSQETSADPEPLEVDAAQYDSNATAIARWFSATQADSPLGLVESYPGDSSITHQAFTYDQALAGILMLKQGDFSKAKKIFNFYNANWDSNGFWTVYNTQSAGGAKVEYEKILGPNAWIALFALHYASATGNTSGITLATKVAKWIKSLPHRDGGLAMGASGTFWADKFSVENNLDAYAIFKLLSTKASSASDRQLFSNEMNAVKSWLKVKAYDSAAGLFKRGGYGDTVKAFDSNAWAVLALGVDTLKKDFGIDANALISKTESTFGVQQNGAFGGNALTAKGFDFSDASNAGAIGRTGVKWVEGTNHMILAYEALQNYYTQPQVFNDSKVSFYSNRADYFLNKNSDNELSENGGLAYTYVDKNGVQVFSDNPYWKTAKGSSVSSSAWAYFSLAHLNPFTQLIGENNIAGKIPSTGTYPKDTYYSRTGSWRQIYPDLWGLRKINATNDIWSLYKGEGIRIAIVDSGIALTHEDIASNIWVNDAERLGLPGVDDDGDGYVDDVNGWDFVDNDANPTDLYGHGTHVAGIAAAVGGNSKGIIGVAPLAKVIPVRVLGSNGSGSISNVARGIEYAAKVGAQVINLSLGAMNLSGYSVSILQRAVDFARSLGSIVVAAAGNSNADVNRFSPANLSGVIAVGATDAYDRRASFSNFGEKLFMTAPGVDILSLGTKSYHIGKKVTNNYYRANGTSMATPFVSGAVALLLDQNPFASFQDIELLLAGGAKDLGKPGWDAYYGYGRLDVAASIKLGASGVLSSSSIRINASYASQSALIVSYQLVARRLPAGYFIFSLKKKFWEF
jgi:subtilisin family serine protease